MVLKEALVSSGSAKSQLERSVLPKEMARMTMRKLITETTRRTVRKRRSGGTPVRTDEHMMVSITDS